MEDARSEEQIEVTDVIGQRRGENVEVALHPQLPAIEGRIRTLLRERLEALEGGKEVREEGLEEQVVGPVGGRRERIEEGLQSFELGAEELPPADK